MEIEGLMCKSDLVDGSLIAFVMVCKEINHAQKLEGAEQKRKIWRLAVWKLVKVDNRQRLF